MKRGVRLVRNQLDNIEKYPVYQNSMTPLGYYRNFNYPANTVFIISAGAAGDIGFSRTNFWAADDCLCFTCQSNLKSRYLYHALKKNQEFLYSRVRKASVPRLSKIDIEKIKIPLPPLAEQERIVSILDRFDALCNDLTGDLPAEIEARQKQYEYYRDRLLNFNRI